MAIDDRVALVTGVVQGVGRMVAEALAARGTRVIACPCTPDASNPLAFNPADVDSIDRLADHVLTKWPAIDLVVAAAEVMATPYAVTAAGIEYQLAYNAVASAVLATRLSPALRAAEAGRFVILGSLAHQLARPDPDDLAGTARRYDPWRAYGASKTAAGLVALRIFNDLMDDAYSTAAVDPGGLLRLSVPSDAPMMLAIHPDSDRVREGDGVASILWAADAPEMFARYGYAERSAPSRMTLQPDGHGGHVPWIGDVDLSDRLWAAIANRLGRPLTFT